MTPAAELQNAFFAGNLEKKQKKGSGNFEEFVVLLVTSRSEP